MKALIRGFGLALMMVTFLGLTGCGTDNESEADKLQKSVGAPPKTDVKGPEAGAPVKSMDEYAKQRQDPYAKMKKTAPAPAK